MVLVLPLLLLCSSLAGQTWSEEVNLAIDRGVHHLLTYQREDGSFRGRHSGGYPTGESALALYALVKSGLKLGDPAVEAAIRFILKNEKFERTYNVATFILALDALGTDQYDRYIQKAGAWLEKSIDRSSDLWTYPTFPSNKVDLSNTQFAVLGLSVAQKHGLEVSHSLWMKVFRAVAECQNDDGGFGYREDLRPYSSGSMTTAGLTVSHLVAKELDRQKTPRIIQDVLDAGWAWLDRVFTVRGNPSHENGLVEHEYPYSTTHPYFNLYFLYGLERIAAFANRKGIGGRDWYKEGALFLLHHQSENGSWNDIDNTAFALLFLKRATFSGLMGRNPIIGAAGPVMWKFNADSTVAPNWFQLGFDDGPWQSSSGAFGTRDAFNGAVRTTWLSNDIRLRRVFQWQEDDASRFKIFVQHDDECSIWINGVKAADIPYYSSGKYVSPKIADRALATMKKGKNLLAVHCHNAGGAGVIDVRLVDLGRRTERQHLTSEEKAKLWWKNPPADGVPFLERWRVLGPIRDPDDALLLASILPDEKAAPVQGQQDRHGKWREHWTRGGWVDFGDTLRLKDDSIYFAFTWLEALQDLKVVLRFGGDDGYRIYLDGKVVISHHGNRPATPDEVSVPLILRRGMHRLLIKVGNATGASGFYARITDRAGQTPIGLVPRLKAKGADLEHEARAHPDFFTIKQLFGQLEPDKTSKIDFRSGKQLRLFAVSGSPPSYPQWQSKSAKAVFPSPPPGARGMAGFQWYAERPTRLYRRMDLPGGKPRLTARVAFSPAILPNSDLGSTQTTKRKTTGKINPNSQVRIRVGIYLRRMTWLVDQTLSPASNPKKAWRGIQCQLAAFAGKNVLVVVELSGQTGGTLWLDDFQLRAR